MVSCLRDDLLGLPMGLALLLQVRVIIRDRTSEGVSVGWVLILLVGFVPWLADGIANSDVPLIVANVVAAIVTTTLLSVMWLLRSGDQVRPSDS